jgi:AcrR family transcriptional regulator
MPYPAKLTTDTILSAALTLLEQGGPDALAMRPLADRLGVRPSSLYRHYPDRAALLGALEDHAARDLHAAMSQAATNRGGHEALHAAAHAYVEYARSHPHLYGLLLAPRAPGLAGPGAGKDLWNHVLTLIEGVTHTPDDTDAAVALWAFLHGFAVLDRSGQFGLSGPRSGFERGLSSFIRGLTS